MIALPVATGWLGDSDCRKQLIAVISGVGVGIALVPGGSGDPLEGRKVVAGLVELLESAPGRVAVLRTDLAGIGRSRSEQRRPRSGCRRRCATRWRPAVAPSPSKTARPGYWLDHCSAGSAARSWRRSSGTRGSSAAVARSAMTGRCGASSGTTLTRYERRPRIRCWCGGLSSIASWESPSTATGSLAGDLRGGDRQPCSAEASSRVALQVPRYLKSWTALSV